MNAKKTLHVVYPVTQSSDNRRGYFVLLYAPTTRSLLRFIGYFNALDVAEVELPNSIMGPSSHPPEASSLSGNDLPFRLTK